MLKYTLRAICIFIIALIVLSQMARADVIHNVTFTVKNNGVVEATTDIGLFTSDIIMEVSGNNMPAPFRRGDEGFGKGNYDEYVIISPLGRNIFSETGPGGYRLPFSFRIKYIQARSAGAFNFQYSECHPFTEGDSHFGIYKIDTDNKPFSKSDCGSISTRTSENAPFAMYFEILKFAFMEDIQGKNGLNNLKLPAGRYTFSPQTFQIMHNIGRQGIIFENWVVNVTVIVEPSIGSVNMPTALPLDVAVEKGNQLTGQGSVLATVTGTLGSNLKILPASANNGQLVKGAERIPYTLSVVPLSGDNKSRLLVDGNQGGAQPQVVIETNAKRDQYQFRFDASFATTLSNLSSGRFSDNVTLIFTTTDLP